jgi:hypothetical protein
MFEDGFHSPKAAAGKDGDLFAFSARERRIKSGVWNCSAGSSDCIASQSCGGKQERKAQEKRSIHAFVTSA